MTTTQILLTHQFGTGWNFAVLRNGRALPADDPRDLRSAAQALQAAILQLQSTVRAQRDDERDDERDARGSS